MSELISGKEAFDAAFNGVSAQWRWANKDEDWRELKAETAFSISELKGDVCEFRLKPRTITINGIEVPAPFEPEEGDDFHVYYLHGLHECGYDWMHSGYYKKPHLVWKSKEEIKQVVAALRSIFK